MKMLVIGDEARTKKYLPQLPIVEESEIVVADRGMSEDEIIALAGDADFVMADAISPVTAKMIASMPNLKLIHSEGVAFNAIDVAAATAAGVPVCNNAGVNAGAVAEQAIMLMLMCLRDALEGNAAVHAGKQIQKKETMMREGFRELGDCTIGFIGYGAIARACAERLVPWGCKMLYNKRAPLDKEEEQRLGLTYATVEEIARTCDIVSLHVPVTDQTRGMANRAFFEKMRPDGILINTARGEVVNQEDLVWALEEGRIAAAGLDVLSPEPVQPDNPLLNMSESATKRLTLSPHVGGITEGMFYRAHRNVWENVARCVTGQPLVNRVN